MSLFAIANKNPGFSKKLGSSKSWTRVKSRTPDFLLEPVFLPESDFLLEPNFLLEPGFLLEPDFLLQSIFLFAIAKRDTNKGQPTFYFTGKITFEFILTFYLNFNTSDWYLFTPGPLLC